MSRAEGKAHALGHLLMRPSDALLTVRMTGWALALPVLKHAVSLQRLARLMWRDGRGSPSPLDVDRVIRMSWRAARLRPLPGRDNCFERSMIAYRYLSALGADPHIVVAMRRTDGTLDGHVWVTVGGVPVAGEDVTAFTSLFQLGERGERIAGGS